MGSDEVSVQAPLRVHEVHLVRGEDHWLLGIEFLHERDNHIINGRLEVRVLGIDHHVDIELIRQLGEFANPVSEGQEEVSLVVGEGGVEEGSLLAALRGEQMQVFHGDAVAP